MPTTVTLAPLSSFAVGYASSRGPLRTNTSEALISPTNWCLPVSTSGAEASCARRADDNDNRSEKENVEDRSNRRATIAAPPCANTGVFQITRQPLPRLLLDWLSRAKV